jgi:hypothetical protein
MKKKTMINRFFGFFLFAVVFSLISVHAASVSVIAPNPGHNSTQVFIPVGRGYITLQDARDSGYLLGANTSVVPVTLLPVSTPYEFANQIYFTSNGLIFTLQSAIDNNFFNGGTKPPSTLVSSGWDSASNVNINTANGVITLQSAISDSLLSPCSSGQHLDASHNCVSNCVNNVGQSCYPSGATSSCATAGTVQCDGSCSGYTFSAFGAQGSCSADSSCDGTGHCQGYSGTDCSSCPFGTTVTGDLNTVQTTYCVHSYSTGGTWPTNYNYQTSAQSPTSWSNSNIQCSSATVCNNFYSGQCTCGVCSPNPIVVNSAWKMKPYGAVSSR